MPENKDYFSDLIDEELDDLTEEEKLAKEEEERKKKEELEKNKNAEEARKRREAEEKEKQKKAEEEKLAKEEERKEAEKKKLDEENAKKSKEEEKVNILGKQLSELKDKYPNVDIAKLDEDKGFRKFIDGKVLGKKNMTELYEEYVELKSELSGKTKEDLALLYEIKQEKTPPSPNSKSNQDPEIYSLEELEKLSEKIPFMNPNDAEALMDKFNKSIEYHSKNKK